MKKFKLIVLLATGILSIILGIVCFGMDEGYYESSYTYGGDAYTGIQNASAQSANNTRALAKITRFGFGSVLLVGGISLVASGLSAFEKDEEKADKDGIKWEGIPNIEVKETVPAAPASAEETKTNQ